MNARWSMRAACLALLPMVAVPALAAFELRDASPAALGAASPDLAAEPMFSAATLDSTGFRVGGSHASLYQIDGLTAECVSAALETRPLSLNFSYSQVGIPGAREFTARVAIGERDGRRIALRLNAERLDFVIEGEAPTGGWALGGAARARITLTRFDVEVQMAADRVLLSGDLSRLGVAPSLPFAFRIWAGNASVAWVDRWERDGRLSPRLVLDMPLGPAARIRFGRGDSPGRTGVSLAIRLKRLELSMGRLDDSSGGVVSGAALSTLSTGRRRRS